MRKIVVILMLTLVVGSAYGQPDPFTLGDGTSGNPYQVSTPEQLDAVRNHLDAFFLQTASIDLTTYISTHYSSNGWLPIGTNAAGERFTGSYDGGGHAITGLWINRESTTEVGLFGCIGHGATGASVVISNVHLTDVGLIEGASGVGSLVGRVNGDENVLIIGCSVIGGMSGKVSGTRATGGLVGANNSFRETPGGENNPVIRQSYANIAVEGRGTLAIGGAGSDYKEKFGGLVGCNQKGNTIDSYARGSVTIVDNPAQRVGGLAGCTDIRGLVDRCYSTGLVTVVENSTDFGGLVGARSGQGNNIGQVNNSYWDTQTSGQTSSAGGTGKTTTEMKTQSTFVNWDFTNTWAIDGSNNDGYPNLRAIVTNFSQDGTTNWKTDAGTTDWNNTDNWTHGIPISSTAVTIPTSSNYPVLSGNVTIASLEINGGASLTIGPNAALRVSGAINNSAGNEGLVIQSNASGTGSLLHNTGDVPATIERYIPGSPDTDKKYFHLVSVPLTTAASPQSGLFLGSHLYEFNVAGQAWSHLGSSTTSNLVVTKGYMIYYPVNEPKTYTFAGPMNNGNISIPLAYGENGSFKGFNLVPNPYPSTLDWTATGAAWTKTNIADAIYIWNSGWSPSLDGYTGNYSSYVDGTGVNGGSNFIPVGQAFFVKASSAEPEPGLTITNAARVHSDQAFFKKSSAAEHEVLRIKAFANNYRDEFVWRFHELATSGFDSQFDAMKMYGLEDAPQLYGLTADNQQLSIFSHPHPTENISIPLGFELGLDGAVSLSFEGMQSFDAQQSIFLEDMKEGKLIDLNSQISYAFAHEQENDPMRFVLHFGTEAPTGVRPEQVQGSVPHQIFAVNKQLFVNIPSLNGHEATIEVYDLLGRKQLHTRVVLDADLVIDGGNLDGIAIIRVVSGQQVFTQRVMLF